LVIGLLFTSTFWIADLKVLPGTAAPATDGIADNKAKIDAKATAQFLQFAMPLSIPTQAYRFSRPHPTSIGSSYQNAGEAH